MEQAGLMPADPVSALQDLHDAIAKREEFKRIRFKVHNAHRVLKGERQLGIAVQDLCDVVERFLNTPSPELFREYRRKEEVVQMLLE